MGKIVRISENDLITLIKNIILEQPDSKMPFQIEKFGYKQGDPSTLSPALKKQSLSISVLDEHIKNLLKDPHTLLGAISLTATVLGFIPPFGPLFFGIAVAADIADAALYFKEGDKYMGTIMGALSIIPGGELAKLGNLKSKIPMFKRLAEKLKNGKLVGKELSMFDDFIIEFGLHKSTISQLLKQRFISTIIKNLPKFINNYFIHSGLKSGVKLVKFLLYGNVLSKLTFKIGATYYTFDELYLALWGNDDDRKYSNIQLLVNYIKKDQKKVSEIVLHKMNEVLSNPETQKELQKKLISMDPKDFNKKWNMGSN